MGVGDVETRIVAATTAAVSAAVTAMRTTANDKWMMTSISNGQQIVVTNIEEA